MKLFSVDRFIEEHHFWETKIHTVSYLSKAKTPEEIVKESTFQVINGLDVSAHSPNIEIAVPNFSRSWKNITSKKIISAGTDGFIFSGLRETPHKSALFLKTADCCPLAFSSQSNNLMGIVHIGWKGLTGGIIENLREKLEQSNECLDDILIWIGPMAGNWFEFWKDNFEEIIFPYMQRKGISKEEIHYREDSSEKVSFHFQKLIIEALKSVGFKEENISFSQKNTLDKNENIPSYRKGNSERIITIVYN